MAQAPATSAVVCPICRGELSDTCGRSIVRLQCSHLFHLDCIGSAFNFAGIMQCPICREMENGVWRRLEIMEQDVDQEGDGDEQHVQMFQQFLGQQWCPIHGLATMQPALDNADQDIAEAEMPAVFPSAHQYHHQHHGQPMITEIFTSQMIIHHPNANHVLHHPNANHVLGTNRNGTNRTSVSSGIQGAPWGHYGANLPNMELGGYEIIREHGRRPYVFHNWFPEARVPAQHQPALYQNFMEPPNHVHQHVKEQVNTLPDEYNPDDEEIHWAPED